MLEQSLENAWKEIWKQTNAPLELVNAFWSEIQKAYKSKTRHYHNIHHINHMMYFCFLYKDKINDIQNLRLAIIYHDVVYSAVKKDNEERSAKLAAKHLKKLNYPKEKIDKCCDYILATKSHSASMVESDLNYFLDFDLQKLGSDWPEYEEYTKQIRLEYRIYPDLIYMPGRKKVLEHFLNLERIYKSPEFFNLYEKQARINLLKEFESIS